MQLQCQNCHAFCESGEISSLDASCPVCGRTINLISEITTAPNEAFASTISHVAVESPSSDGQLAGRLAHFELLEKVGVGGFGTVWRARDTVLGRIVALKVPRRGQLSDSEKDYFLRDARAAAQLHHANIVSVHEVGCDDDTPFIASDFVDGGNLKEWLADRRLSVQTAATLVADIAAAVHHAHERGVIHRDLKPGNILMDREGRPHVADFGLAKRESGEISVTMEGQILGTPGYMSPE